MKKVCGEPAERKRKGDEEKETEKERKRERPNYAKRDVDAAILNIRRPEDT